MTSTPNTTERGQPGGLTPSGEGSSFIIDPLERIGELQFPQSVAIHDAMRTQDGLVDVE